MAVTVAEHYEDYPSAKYFSWDKEHLDQIADYETCLLYTSWSDAAVVIPWVVYQTYGDERILEENWKCMHEWVDYIHNHVNENGLWMSGYQYGDWLALDREMGDKSVGATDVYFVANASYIYVTDLVAKTARVLKKYGEAAYYEVLREETLKSFREEYYTCLLYTSRCV